jgi:hypothetical protein
MVNPFMVVSMTVTPASVAGGVAAVGDVTLNAEPGVNSHAITVKLSSSLTTVKVPASASVAEGKLSGSFTVTSAVVTAPVTATITGTYGSSSASADLTVQPAALLSVAVSPATVRGALTTAVTGTVRLTGPAPVGGLVATLASSNTGAATVPVSVTVLAGHSSATFVVKHFKVTQSTPVTISATLGSVTATTVLTVNP